MPPTLNWVRSYSGFSIGGVGPLPEGGVAVAGLGAAPDLPRNLGGRGIFVAKLDEEGRTVA